MEDRYMKDLDRLFPEEDGRRLRGIANRLSKIDDVMEREEILVLEFGVEPRYERTPTGVALIRRERGKDVQGNPIPAQGKN